MHKIIKLNLLTLCICAANQSYALQALNDQILSDVTGQDGISMALLHKPICKGFFSDIIFK